MRIDPTNRLRVNKHSRASASGTPQDKGGFSDILNQKMGSLPTPTPSFEAPGSLVNKSLQWGEGPKPSSRERPSVAKEATQGKIPDSLIGLSRKDLLAAQGTHRPAVANASFLRPSGSPRLPKKLQSYTPMIEKYSQKYGVDPNLVAGVIKQESGYNSNAVSRAGAMGLMQLMPDTARAMGVSDPFNPDQNIRGGVKFLRKMLDRFDGNTELALAAYNAGPLAVEKYGNRVPPYAETRHYVKAVAAHTESLRVAGAFATQPLSVG